jgi:hypothetical protein
MKANSIIVVGGGSAGWMTATTLIKSFPDKQIRVIEPEDIPIVGVGESTLAAIKHWARYVGIDEKEFFEYTDASYKMSIKFTDFYKKGSGSFHYPFGFPIKDGDRNPFADWHFKKYFYPNTPIQDFAEQLFPQAQLFLNNKFHDNVSGEFDNFNSWSDVAYHFDATKFGAFLRDKICVPNGVGHIKAKVTEVIKDESGIRKLMLDNDFSVSADLYIDCTGFKSMLLGEELKEPFESYEDMLPNNRAWATRLPYVDRSKELEPYTNCIAHGNGWMWNIPLWSRLGVGFVYSDKYISPEKAKVQFVDCLMDQGKLTIPRKNRDELEQLEFRDIQMRVGIHSRTFVKNVVAIGLSAGFIEPLESNGLFSVHEFLNSLVDILSYEEINQYHKDMYNITVRDLYDNFAKFVALHYALSARDDSQYWNDVRERNFNCKWGDPYTPYNSRIDSFYNLSWRYMEEWGHPEDSAGIPYISTGMNMLMMNRRRIENLNLRWNTDLKKEIDDLMPLWKLRMRKWKEAADNSPTLEQYLKELYYKDRD